MRQELHDSLCEYLGHLMFERENEGDWIMKDRISEKINAVNELLGIDRHEPTWYEKIAKELKAVK